MLHSKNDKRVARWWIVVLVDFLSSLVYIYTYSVFVKYNTEIQCALSRIEAKRLWQRRTAAAQRLYVFFCWLVCFMCDVFVVNMYMFELERINALS